jgi:peptide-methionine (R)-S-oxide reductase
MRERVLRANCETCIVITRRVLLTGSAVGVAAAASGSAWWTGGSQATAETFEVTHTDVEWHQLLTTNQYAVLRQSATERPFTSALLHEKRRGKFDCVGCDLDLFSSTTKYDSGNGPTLKSGG